jgi:hypothetical protein
MAASNLSIFESLIKELHCDVPERFGGGHINLQIEGSTPQSFEVTFFASDIQRCILKIGNSHYGYFFKMPLTLMSQKFWTIEDIKALGYFAKEYLVEKAFNNKTGLGMSNLNELFDFIRYCDGTYRATCLNVTMSMVPHHSEENDLEPEKRDKDESFYSDKLAKELSGAREVVNPSGLIDVLTDLEVIEVKNADNWPSAVGQVLSYVQHYPMHSPRIHLFGNVKKVDAAREVCTPIGIKVTCE